MTKLDKNYIARQKLFTFTDVYTVYTDALTSMSGVTALDRSFVMKIRKPSGTLALGKLV